MSYDFEIPDARSANPDDYRHKLRRGQMKRSWHKGARRRHDGLQTVSFDDGLTWGSIGQLLGYLLGEVDVQFQDELYERLVAQYELTDRGSPLLEHRHDRRVISVGTWNLRYSAEAHSYRRLAYLAEAEWDVVALQEVSRKAWEVFQREALFDEGYYTLDGFGITPSGGRHHGVAILTRNGVRARSPRLIPGLPKSERGLSVILEGLAAPVEMISWHAPNAVGEGVKIKMQAYQAITTWLREKDGPQVLGFDGNHWNRNIQLDLPAYHRVEDPHFIENLFFAANAEHDLEDALVSFYQEDGEAYQELLQERTTGPLAVSYVRGSTKRPVEDRFDYIFVSSDFDVRQCRYDYEGATKAGSDHAFVEARIRLEA
jgi:endonuclease/exonuclease/phosphatase family metal-dependent hydrolase